MYFYNTTSIPTQLFLLISKSKTVFARSLNLFSKDGKSVAYLNTVFIFFSLISLFFFIIRNRSTWFLISRYTNANSSSWFGIQYSCCISSISLTERSNSIATSTRCLMPCSMPRSMSYWSVELKLIKRKRGIMEQLFQKQIMFN